MSGLIVLYGKNNEQEKLMAMASRLAHRGQAVPRSFFTSDKVFHHAILSSEGREAVELAMPVLNDGETIAIAFDGRLYNHRELATEIGLEPAQDSEADARLVLRLYEAHGPDCVRLLDGAFAFAIADRDQGLFVARDPLGLKPLYVSEPDGAVILSSEMKAMTGLVDDFREFPAGSVYLTGQGIQRVFQLPQAVDDPIESREKAVETIMTSLQKAVMKRIAPDKPLGVFLSGGLDSSIIAALTARVLPGVDTFAVGFAGSQDLEHARLCAEFLGTRHHEYVYDLDEMMTLLPTVIRHLESFDAALVRSSVPNFILARLASRTVRVAFTGEGADELFCGYPYMLAMSKEDIRRETIDVLQTLHNTNLQRGDRMAMAHGIEVHVPFLDLDFIRQSMRIPVSMMIGPEGQEKWILRQAVKELLPPEIVVRKKQKFSHGAGSFLALADVAERTITDDEFARESVTTAGHRIQNKEELMYYRIFRDIYPQPDVERAIDFSRSL